MALLPEPGQHSLPLALCSWKGLAWSSFANVHGQDSRKLCHCGAQGCHLLTQRCCEVDRQDWLQQWLKAQSVWAQLRVFLCALEMLPWPSLPPLQSWSRVVWPHDAPGLAAAEKWHRALPQEL